MENQQDVQEEFDWSLVELDEDEDESGGGGAPEWMITFADLMTLLMCFFVLLVAFSELDIKRYRMIAGSMKEAFGIQRDVRAFDPPKGTSFIAQEYSAGTPSFAAISSPKDVRSGNTEEKKRTVGGIDAEMAEKTRQEVAELTEVLGEFIETGIVHVEGGEDRIVIRIQESGLFRSGRSKLKKEFLGTLALLGEALNEIPGLVTVSGHTDSLPVGKGRFRSNWELSSARAGAVVELLREEAGIPGERLAAVGYADTRPVAPNDTRENRADNRRVEINLIKRSHNEWGQAESLAP